MPSTSPSWSDAGELFRWRSARPRWRPPVPADAGRGANCSNGRRVQVDQRGRCALGRSRRELGGPGATEPELTELPRTAGCPLTGASHHDLLAVINLRAMLSPTVSAPSMLPPAAFSASAIRAPGASVTRPGVCTRPTTLTTTGWLAESRAPGSGRGLPWPPCQPAAVCRHHRCGLLAHQREDGDQHRDRRDRGQSDSAARPGSARTLASQPRSCCVEPSGSQRGNSELGSVSASLSSASRSDGAAASGRAPSRRCNRSAGSSVRMGRR